MKETTTTNGKPLLDAESFQKLLAAAYVLQEHNDELRTTGPAKPEIAEPSRRQAEPADILDTTHLSEAGAAPEYTQTLAKIVATQQQIQMSHLDLQPAMNLIAERTRQITRAGGAAIGLLEQQELVYRAASGNAGALLSAKLDLNDCLSARCLAHAETFYSAKVDGDSRLDSALCAKYGIKSLIAVPIFYEGKVAGSLELHFVASKAVREQDIRTCQLMAGLVTEAMARAAELEWKHTLASERATMLEALDRLKPQLQQLAGERELTKTSSMQAGNGTGAAVAPAMSESIRCPECGYPLEADQLFCGQCGQERPAPKFDDRQSDGTASWDPGSASAAESMSGLQAEISDANPLMAPSGEDWESIAGAVRAAADNHGVLEQSAGTSDLNFGMELRPSSSLAGTTMEQADAAAKPYPWVSASKAKAWLDSYRKTDSQTLVRLWKTRRADVYLVVAVILVLVALPFIIWSNSEPRTVSSKPVATSASNSGPAVPRRRRAPAPPKLTFMEQLLVNMGLAEPPPTPAYSGNPNTQVWEDLHTAQYYCPGSDLYGKTPKGKFTTQRDAQLDQFEPAYRQACD